MPQRKPLTLVEGHLEQLQDGDSLDVSILVLSAGTAVAPSLYFGSDSNSGMYWLGENRIGFSTAGAYRFSIGDTFVDSDLPITAIYGSASVPAYTFEADTDTGMYHYTANTVGMAAGGVLTTTFGVTATSSFVPFGAPTGSLSRASFYHTNDPQTGINFPDNYVISCITQGVERLRITNEFVSASVPVSVPDPLANTSGLGHAISRKYVESRGQNLVTNSNGHMGSNYNFGGFYLSQDDTHDGQPASFLAFPGHSTYRYSDEFIPVDPTKSYRISLWAKAGNADGTRYNADNKQYFGIEYFDSDLNFISSYHFTKVSTAVNTTLAAPLNPGDTTLTLTDATGWYNSTSGVNRHFAWYPYTNSKGYTYPVYGYTRNVSPDYCSLYDGAWAQNGISGNTITLTSAWTGPALPAGTPIKNCYYSVYRNSPVAYNVAVPDTWTHYSAVIGPASTADLHKQIRGGAAYMRFFHLLNNHGITDTDIRISELTITEVDINNPELRPDGTAAAPAYSFYNDLDTGFFRYSPDVIGVSTGGVQRAIFGQTSYITTLLHKGPDGSAAAPAFTFEGDQDTGIHRYGTNAIAIACGGVDTFIVLSTHATCVLPLLEPEFSCARVSIAQGEPDVPETTQAV
jgi:hypothetical protein